jgi:uridine kinase
MANEIVQSLFGVTPEAYQRAQQDRIDTQATTYANLDPFQQANFAIGRGAYGLAGAVGGALGGQDPELQRITMRQQIAGQLNPNDLTTFDRGIEMMRQAGDGQGALMLSIEADKFKQQSLVRQDEALARQDAATKRRLAMESQARTQDAQSLLKSAYRPATPEQQQFVEIDNQGQPVAIPARPASFNINPILPQLIQSPEGRAAITEQANLLPALRKLGASAAPEVNPFTPFTTDAAIPKNVKIYAEQLSKSFVRGDLDPEKADEKIKQLADMTQRVQQFEQSQQQIKTAQENANILREQGLAQSLQFRTLTAQIAQQNLSLAQQRAQFEQDLKTQAAQDKKTAAANKPLPSYLAKEEEGDFAAATAATNIATDAYGYINKIKTGDIKFGLKDKASIRARQLVGSGDPDVLAREDYDKFVKTLVNESLRLNKGTQTEGDAVRAAKELESSESKEAAANAMRRLVEINSRRVTDAAKSVETRRANANFPSAPQPIVVPTFDVQIITPTEEKSFLANPKYPEGTVYVNPQGVRTVKTLQR